MQYRWTQTSSRPIHMHGQQEQLARCMCMCMQPRSTRCNDPAVRISAIDSWTQIAILQDYVPNNFFLEIQVGDSLPPGDLKKKQFFSSKDTSSAFLWSTSFCLIYVPNVESNWFRNILQLKVGQIQLYLWLLHYWFYWCFFSFHWISSERNKEGIYWYYS